MMVPSISKPAAALFRAPVAQAVPLRHSCGSADVRHSHRRGWLIRLAKRLGFEAYRCRACGKRFFRKQG